LMNTCSAPSSSSKVSPSRILRHTTRIARPPASRCTASGVLNSSVGVPSTRTSIVAQVPPRLDASATTTTRQAASRRPLASLLRPEPPLQMILRGMRPGRRGIGRLISGDSQGPAELHSVVGIGNRTDGGRTAPTSSGQTVAGRGNRQLVRPGSDRMRQRRIGLSCRHVRPARVPSASPSTRPHPQLTQLQRRISARHGYYKGLTSRQ
jgi:hypothetical protein